MAADQFRNDAFASHITVRGVERNAEHEDYELPLMNKSTHHTITVPELASGKGSAVGFLRKHHAWPLELLALLLATTALAAAIILLLVYRDRQAPQWKLSITLNTIISILGTLAQGGLLACIATSISQFGWLSLQTKARPMDQFCYFDGASRGPVGSLMFLAKYNVRRIASIGAITTVLTAALLPFLQQTIGYTLVDIISDDQAAITVAANSWNVSGTGAPYAGSRVFLPYNIRAAVYSGLMSGGSLSPQNPPYICPSGNCTWDPFATLAVNVQCLDLTQDVHLDCSYGATLPNVSQPDNVASPYCRLTPTTDNFVLQNLLNGSESEHLRVLSINATTGRWASYQPDIWNQFADISTIIQLITWVKATGQLAQSTSEPQFMWISSNTTHEAKTCAVYLTLQDVWISVSRGLYLEKVMHEYRQVDNATAFRFDPSGQNDTVFDAMDVFGLYRDLSYQSELETAAQTGSQVFTASAWSWRALSDMFTGTIMPETASNANVSFGTDDGAIGNNDIVGMLYAAPNITQVLVNTARMLTNAIRSNDTLLLQAETHGTSVIAPSEAVEGQTLVQFQFVRVHFAWLALPIVACLLATIFLALAIIKTHEGIVGPWKLSPLALLFHSKLDCELISYIQEEHAELLRSEDGMRKIASKLEAKVDQDSVDGLILVQRRTFGSK